MGSIKLVPKMESVGGRHIIQAVMGEPQQKIGLNAMVAAIYETEYKVPAIPGIAIPRFIMSNAHNMSGGIKQIRVSSAGTVMFSGVEGTVVMHEGDMLILERDYITYLPHDAMESIIHVFNNNRGSGYDTRYKDKS